MRMDFGSVPSAPWLCDNNHEIHKWVFHLQHLCESSWGSCGRSKLQAGSKEGIKNDEQEDRSPAR